MSDPTIALCLMTCNDLEMLRATMIHNLKWADQICILDMGSTDGTQEFCLSILRDREEDVHDYRDRNTVPQRGFAEARNHIAGLAKTDWIWHGQSNCCLDWKDAGKIHGLLAECPGDVISVNCLNVEPNGDPIEKAVTTAKVRLGMPHRCIVRRGSGIEIKGYIHEEPYRGELNLYEVARVSDLREYHFEGLGNNHLRQCRYAWMIRRAIREPELRRYTNSWWYQTYYPEHKEDIERMAEEYERMGVDK